jgi:hypothetical protein
MPYALFRGLVNMAQLLLRRLHLGGRLGGSIPGDVAEEKCSIVY